ncbi:hypothetical protein B0H19DRAFT_1255620 [Mycena capillaripes]|nr:hypothetical protein B0H19DRAFT_1255620 [Mycena capillaripes]
MQTRRQAKQAAELAAAAQAVVQSSAPPPSSPHAHNSTLIWAPSFASSLSSLTPTSSFVSDAGTAQPNATNLSTIDEEEGEFQDDSNMDVTTRVTVHTFGVPLFVNHGDRSLKTPLSSQSKYPREVFETPRKNFQRPTDAERRAAEWIRDSEIAKSGGLAQLTRNGTLLVSPEPPEEPEHGRTGYGLGSAFASPSSSRVWKRTTASPSRPSNTGPLRGAKTVVIDPETGVPV